MPEIESQIFILPAWYCSTCWVHVYVCVPHHKLTSDFRKISDTNKKFQPFLEKIYC